MRRGLRALAAASGVMLVAATAAAETYRVRGGQISLRGVQRPLLGYLELSLSENEGAADFPTVLRVDDFSLSGGRLGLAPAEAIEHDGRVPVAYLSIADQIHISGPRVATVRLRSGGEVVAESDDEVTFRFLELRADHSNLGRALGQIAGSALPRRLELAGTLHQVDQRFRILRPEECALPSDGSPGGVELGGRIAWSWARFGVNDLGDSTLRGELRSDGSLYLAPTGVSFLSVSQSVSTMRLILTGAPTLEELGMRAPDGASVTLDGNGVLRVETPGDLFVEGTFPEIPDLTHVELHAGGSLVVTGSLRLPEGVTLGLRADGSLQLADVAEPGPFPPVVGVPTFCNGLFPIRPAAEQVVGQLSLVASAAQPTPIDVMPWSTRNPVKPGSARPIPVVLLGSPALDVRDVLPESLRLGPGDAEALRGRLHPRIAHVNRDPWSDLLAFFDVRNAEVAFGDTELCLSAETRDLVALEGCDAIDSVPRRWPAARAQRGSAASQR